MTIGYVVAQLLVFPIGRAWERLPRWRVPLGRFTFDVNPGRFTVKEHALIVICVNLTAATPYGLGAAVATISPVYWNRDFGAGWLFLYFFTSQGLGFGLAGLARRWLVYPGMFPPRRGIASDTVQLLSPGHHPWPRLSSSELYTSPRIAALRTVGLWDGTGSSFTPCPSHLFYSGSQTTFGLLPALSPF